MKQEKKDEPIKFLVEKEKRRMGCVFLKSLPATVRLGSGANVPGLQENRLRLIHVLT